MAQTPPVDSGIVRPLPRPSLPQGRSIRPPRFQPLDGVWIGIFAALAFLLAAGNLSHISQGWPNALLKAADVAAVYLLGWRARDRATGITAALLTAISLPFIQPAIPPAAAAFALLTLMALFAFVAGSSLAALTLAGLATLLRLDGIWLGLVLLLLALAQQRRRAWLGTLLYVILAFGGMLLLHFADHIPSPHLHLAGRLWLLTWISGSSVALVSWLVLPFFAELTDPIRRARWLPMVCWTLVYIAAESVIRTGAQQVTLFPLMPVWFLLCGAGLSRLLPAITGDIPLPWARYALAALAVISLAGIRLQAEWHEHGPAAVASPQAYSLAAPKPQPRP